MRVLAVALAVSSALALVSPLAGCGKRGAPNAPGPPQEIIYPRTYPSR